MTTSHLSERRFAFPTWCGGLFALPFVFAVACATSPSPTEPKEASMEKADVPPPPVDYGIFKLKPEPTGPCQKVDVVDVNLGNAPEYFIRAAHCQVNGTEPSPELIKELTFRLRHEKTFRRVDLVRELLEKAGRKAELKYSDPWENQPDLGPGLPKVKARDIGAVCMFFFSCPGGTNCGMGWANTHAPGMDGPVPSLGFGDKPEGVYTPDHPGFWRRELSDAKYAGLSFLALNTYGPDIEDGKLAPLATALGSLEDPVKIALFDDTWTWGEPWFSPFWKQKPNLLEVEATAQLLYTAKWKAFFSQIDKKHWYRFKGQPFIYFYNAGKLNPRGNTGPVIARMKELFKADFGEEPFVMADSAYFDDRRMNEAADASYKWFTFHQKGKRSRSKLKGHIMDHAMVKWDAVGRDHPDQIAKPYHLIIKDDRILDRILRESDDAEVLMIATWNDLGEGTGINRNYDYYVKGQWLPPDHFMKLIRKSQSEK